jgi:Restriction alleviation protein Lar
MPSTKVELLPCPFCGGEAKRFTIEEEGDNFGGDVIVCTGVCGASSHVEFGRKENLVSLWNTRTSSHGGEELREALAGLVNAYGDPEAGEVDRRLAMKDARAALASPPPVDRAEAARERVKSGHDLSCPSLEGGDDPCDCGFDKAAHVIAASKAAQPLEGLTSGEGDALAHLKRMIAAAANYVEPTTYIARHPDTGRLGDCQWVREFPEPDNHQSAEGKAATRQRRDQAFIRDMLYMLDGPEQRAAMLAAIPSNHAGSVGEAERYRAALQKIANVRPIAGKCHSNGCCAIMEGIAVAALHPIAAQEKGV